MKKVYRIVTAIIALAIVMQLAGCSKSSDNNTSKTSNTTAGETKQITLRVMDWSDGTKARREEFHKQFMQKYPNIKIEYTQLTIDQYKNTILTAVKSDSVPDLFPVPVGMKLATLVKDGWYQPMDEFVGEDFKKNFVDGTFVEGTTVIGGKTYAVPEWISFPDTMVYYNKKIFKEAGLNPEQPPKTFTEFREAAKKITAAGKGKYYGIIEGGKQINRWDTAVRAIASLGGDGLNTGNPTNIATGKATFDSKAVIDAVGFFKGLAEDKSYHPNTMNLSAPEARALFGQGQAGFIIQGSWCVGTWKKDNPNLEFGVMPPPVPDSGVKGSVAMFNPGAWMGISSKSKNAKEAGIYLKELYSESYQGNCVADGSAFSAIKGINEKYLKVAELKEYYDVALKVSKFAPDPVIKNPEIASVYAEYKDVQPNLASIVQGVVAGSIKDYESKLKELSQKSQAELERAIKAAQDKGAKVDAKDFTFPNWDPMKDYKAEDYKAAK